MSPHSIKIRNLELGYNQSGDYLSICKELNIDIQLGKITGIVGPNGSGKSTLMKALLGQKEIHSGSIAYPENLTAKNPRIAYIPQNHEESFFTWASLKNNIRFAMPNFFQNWKDHGTRILALQKEFGIEVNLNLKPVKCSGGMLQQAAFLRAMASDAPLILADEPFSALDFHLVRKLYGPFSAHVKNTEKAAVLILHDLQSLAYSCDRIFVIPGKPYSSELNLPGFQKIAEINNHALQNATDATDETIREKILVDGTTQVMQEIIHVYQKTG